MYLVQVDVICAEAPGTVFALLNDALFSCISMQLDRSALIVLRIEVVLSFLGIPAKTIFCENLNFIALALYRLTNDFLTQPKTVGAVSMVVIPVSMAS